MVDRKDHEEFLLPALLDDDAIDRIIGEDATIQPWDRLSGEGVRAYRAFCTYRDLGVERTVQAVVDKVGGSIGTYRTLSSVHGWVSRAEAFDDHLERIERKLIERGKLEARRRQINLGQVMQSKALEGLLSMNPYTATPRDLSLMADVGAKLERAGRGDVDTRRLEVTGDGGGPIQVAQSLNADDRRELLAQIQAQIGSRLGAIEGPKIISGEVIRGDEES